MSWRIWVTVLLLVLSFADLTATFIFVQKYIGWQPNKPLNLIENNPLLVFLWNQFGLILGTIIGTVIIWTLLYIIGKSAHWIIVVLFIIFFIWALFNHYTNMNLLEKLVEQYPSGHLPENIFGKVGGNN